MPRPEVFNRAEVIQKVQGVFWDKGYNGTSMQDLVDATGLNRSSIYNSFGSKHELFLLSLKQYQKGNMDGLDSLTEQSSSALAALRTLFQNAVEEATDPNNKGCMMVNCATELANQQEDVKHLIARSNENIKQKFYDLLEAAKDWREIASDSDSELLAHYLVMSLQGIRVNGLTNQDPVLLGKLVDQIFKSVK